MAIEMLISIAQVRAGRGLLGWSKAKLAQKADVSLGALKRYESEDEGEIPDEVIEALRHALEAGGVEFTNGGQPGVRVKALPETLPLEQLNASNDE